MNNVWQRLGSVIICVAVLLSGCGRSDVLRDRGASVSWAGDGTLYFTAYATGDDRYAFSSESIYMPYQVSPDGGVAQIDFDALDDCWVADTVQATEPDQIILAGRCAFSSEYQVVSYELSSQLVEAVAVWRIEGRKGLKIWTAWSADTTRSFEASGWLSYTKEGCSSIARVENYRFEPLKILGDRFEVDAYSMLDYQEIECWQGFQAGQILVSPAGLVGMIAMVHEVSTLFVYDPATEELSEFPLAAEATGLSFCGPDGDIAVAMHGATPRVVRIDANSGERQAIVEGAFEQISCSPDGKAIAVIDATTESEVYLVDL